MVDPVDLLVALARILRYCRMHEERVMNMGALSLEACYHGRKVSRRGGPAAVASLASNRKVLAAGSGSGKAQ